MNPVAHLVESTLFAGAAALLTLTLSRASARARHAIWLAASVKFVVPFALLAAAGTAVGASTTALRTPEVSGAVRWLGESLSFLRLETTASSTIGLTVELGGRWTWALALLWITGAAIVGTWRWRQRRALRRVSHAAAPLAAGREVEALCRASERFGPRRRLEVRQLSSHMEPGILGVFRPLLLWPTGLSERLDDDELDAIMAHEVCHVVRSDNLGASIQMIVETLFWFHPVVWWVGTKLVAERERACDEEVVRMGTDKERYAESILKVCGFCLRAPAAAVAGVCGSSLRERIERIVSAPAPRPPSLAMRLLLIAAAISSAGAPFATGVLRASIQDQRKVHEVGNGITSPKLLYEVKPSYTSEAMRAKIQGVILLSVIVLDDGTVGDVEIVRSLDPDFGLDEEAVNTLKQWIFEPARKDKKPVTVRIDVEMSFKLR
jgi:bla regulator protein blaR1